MSTPRSTGTARKALEAEAVDTSDIKFTFDGEAYTVPKDVFKNLDVMEALEANKSILFVKAALGATQYAKFRAKDRTYDVDIPNLINAITDAVVGAPAGE